MEKIGMVTLKESNIKKSIVWSQSDHGFERLDVIENLDAYSLVDTSNCDAAYYRKTTEMFLGDVEIIKRILSTKSKVATFKSPVNKKFEVVDGQVIITHTKEDSRVGIKQITKMINGNLSYEYYETDDTIILIDVISKSKGMDIKPINVKEYTSYNISEDKYIKQLSDAAEYHTEEYLRARYPLDHMDNYDFVVVDSMISAIARLERWANADTKVKAVDLETTGFEWFMLGKDVITGIVLSYNENESTYYPFRQENFRYNLPISFMQTILDTIRDQPEDVKVIAHNGKVEKQGIWKEDIHYVANSDYAKQFNADWEMNALRDPDLRIDGDSFLLSILVNPVFFKGAHALKSLAFKVRRKFFLELTDVFKNGSPVKFNTLPPNIVKLYACPDTANTIAVWNALIEQLPADEFGILNLECKLLEVTAGNEFYGMRTKRDVLAEALENETYKCKVLGDMFRGIHKTSKNINSNQVRADIFYNKLRAPVDVRTKTGAPSTSNEALKRIVELGTLKTYDETKIPKPIVDLYGKVVVKGEAMASNKYPSLVILNQYAKSMKELGALKRIDRKSVQDRVMFSLNQAGAATGRQTSDAHQYSDGMKKLIQADTSEYRLWSADYKQIELRILAYEAGQQDLIELESDKFVDIHRAITSIITRKPIWAISAEERKKRKSTNFGVVYDMSAFGLAKKNAGPAYSNEDLIEARKSINDFYNGFPYIKAKKEENRQFLLTNGYIKTPMGRYRYFKDLLDPEVSEKRKSSMLRAGGNHPVQGFGADFLKIAECNINEYIKEKGWDKKILSEGLWLPKVRIMLSIHDEVLVSTHKSIPIEEIIKMFKICMEINVKGAPPFFSAPAMVGCWYDGKLDQYEMDLAFRDELLEAWDRDGTRLLHADTYDETLDYKDVDAINEWCRKFRKLNITQDDYNKEGRIELTQATIQKCISEIPSEMMLRLRKHFISRDEHFSEDNIREIIIQRVFDPAYNHYLEDLSRFRSRQLRGYMHELIRQYKTVDEVAAHVTHPEFTHTLIAMKINKDEKFEHIEAIREATRRYMEDTDSDEVMHIIDAEDVDVRKDIEYSESVEDLEEFLEFNEDGELIVDEDDEQDEDDYTSKSEASAIGYEKLEREYAVYMMSDVLIDLSDISYSDVAVNNVMQSIAKVANPNDPYRVCLIKKGEIVPTSFKVAFIPDEINSIMRYHCAA